MPALSPLLQLVDQTLNDEERRAALRAFAREHGWHPSDQILHYRDTAQIANGHLVVEHGLNNTAVISFLRNSVSFTHLSFSEQHSLISLSYNNLVDWHLFPDRGGLLRVFNRSQPLKTNYITLSEHPDAHRADSFDKLIGRKPTPNVPALDDALISTVARWRRLLASELGLVENTTPLAELFNGIFFVRALEDDQRKDRRFNSPTLLERVSQDGSTLRQAIRDSIEELTRQGFPTELVNLDLLRSFDVLHIDTAKELVSDFYQSRFAPYEYDFSLMSKHALSRIYEKYISILRPSRSRQRVLFSGLEVSEENKRGLGEVYTPQYIARFFSRFLRENTTPKEFWSLRCLDPACGSGIFLRTLLETQCDPARVDPLSIVDEAFENVHGIDVEENACKAAKLSLSLLHLVLTGRFPRSTLKIQQANALEWFTAHDTLVGSFDAVIANPPFVRWEQVPEEWQPLVLQFLQPEAVGRPDLYLAFVKLAYEAIRPGGFLLFVLPHAFLMSENAKALRRHIASELWIRHLVDLSQLNVFDDASSYPVLLVAQRKRAGFDEEPAIVTRCNSFAGQALEAALEGREESTPFYEVYRVPQSRFESASWRTLAPDDYAVAEKLSKLPPLKTMFTIAQGSNSGNDDVFVLRRETVPSEELTVYAPLLRDREMLRFAVPADTPVVTFYPFTGERPLLEEELRANYPWTWAYLLQHQDKLSERSSVKKGALLWWRPERPRPPRTMLRPKVVGPHLMLFPRFGLDASGAFVVSRTPFVFHQENDLSLLKMALAFLNSKVGHWQIATQSHRYSRGYARLEAVTLREFRLPSPATISPRLLNTVVELVDELIRSPNQSDLESRLDQIVSEIYGVDTSALPEIAIEAK